VDENRFTQHEAGVPLEPLLEGWNKPIRLVPHSEALKAREAADRIAELHERSGRSTEPDAPPVQEDGDVTQVDGRFVFRRERQCPVCKAPHWAVFEAGRAAVYGPWQSRLVSGELVGHTVTSGEIVRDRAIITPAQPGQSWEQSPCQAFRELAVRLPLRPWDIWRPDPGSIQAEAARLLEQSPQVWQRVLFLAGIGLPEPPAGAFELGAVSCTPGPGKLGVDPRPFVRQHLAGDTLAAEPLTEKQERFPQLHDLGVQSRVALRSGHGLITSVFPIPGRENNVLQVVTLLSDRPPETIVFTNRD